jgi:hypothetical protein
MTLNHRAAILAFSVEKSNRLKENGRLLGDVIKITHGNEVCRLGNKGIEIGY